MAYEAVGRIANDCRRQSPIERNKAIRMRKRPAPTEPSFVYIAPTIYGQSFKVGKADNPFARLYELGFQRFDLPRVICLRVGSAAQAFRLETKVKHYFQRLSPQPELNPLNRYEGRNAEWFNAALLSELDACLDECGAEIAFQRIDNYHQQFAAVTSRGAIAGLGYEATATSSAKINDRDNAIQLAQLLRDLIAVSFQVTVLTQPGGELTEVQCKSVARPEARQRLQAIKDGLRDLTWSKVAKRAVLVVHALAESEKEVRLHLQFSFAAAPTAPPKSEASRAIRDIYEEVIGIVRGVLGGWEQPAICVMDSLGIRPRRPTGT